MLSGEIYKYLNAIRRDIQVLRMLSREIHKEYKECYQARYTSAMNAIRRDIEIYKYEESYQARYRDIQV